MPAQTPQKNLQSNSDRFLSYMDQKMALIVQKCTDWNFLPAILFMGSNFEAVHGKRGTTYGLRLTMPDLP